MRLNPWELGAGLFLDNQNTLAEREYLVSDIN